MEVEAGATPAGHPALEKLDPMQFVTFAELLPPASTSRKPCGESW